MSEYKPSYKAENTTTLAHHSLILAGFKYKHNSRPDAGFDLHHIYTRDLDGVSILIDADDNGNASITTNNKGDIKSWEATLFEPIEVLRMIIRLIDESKTD